MIQNRLMTIIPVLLLLLLLVSCAPEDPQTQRSRAAAAAAADDPIMIGFVWPFSEQYDFLPQGVYMAVDEINAAGGLLGGRPIMLVERDDEDSVREGRLIAQEFAENPNITAVIGHAWSYVSIPAAPLYEFNGLIMLSPSATSPELTRSGYRYIFRNVASDSEVGRQLANYAHSQGYRSIMILYLNDSYGRELSNVFENEADKLGIQIIDRRPYLGSERSFDRILRNWRSESFDAIFIAGKQEAAAFILQARQFGIDVPVLASDGLDTPRLWETAGPAANGVVVVSHYHPDNPREEQQAFIESFTRLYGMPPDTWAAQGYDAVKLLAYAIETAGTTEPSAVADVLRSTVNWPGVTGPHTFSANGDVIDKPVVLMVMNDGVFEFLDLAVDVDETPEQNTETPEATAEPAAPEATALPEPTEESTAEAEG